MIVYFIHFFCKTPYYLFLLDDVLNYDAILDFNKYAILAIAIDCIFCLLRKILIYFISIPFCSQFDYSDFDFLLLSCVCFFLMNYNAKENIRQ